MNPWLLLIPPAGALVGGLVHWVTVKALFYPEQPRRIFGWRLQGLIHAKREALAGGLAAGLSKFLLNPELLEQLVADPENYRRLAPLIDEQMDQFLKVRLKQSMPIVGMFIGDKTIGQLKEVFNAELEQLFPQIMKKLVGQLLEKNDLETLIRGRLAALPPQDLSGMLRSGLKKELLYFKFLGLITGLLAGSGALLLIYILPGK